LSGWIPLIWIPMKRDPEALKPREGA